MVNSTNHMRAITRGLKLGGFGYDMALAVGVPEYIWNSTELPTVRIDPDDFEGMGPVRYELLRDRYKLVNVNDILVADATSERSYWQRWHAKEGKVPLKRDVPATTWRKYVDRAHEIMVDKITDISKRETQVIAVINKLRS